MQLLLQAFLQRIINSGGYLFREYGLGRKRTDLLFEEIARDRSSIINKQQSSQDIISRELCYFLDIYFKAF